MLNLDTLFIVPALAFCIAIIILFFLIKSRFRNIAMDEPNHRSLHSIAIPRTGGLAIVAALMISWIIFLENWLLITLVFLLVVICFIDDIRGLSVRWRFFGQIGICTIFMFAYYPTLPLWAIGFAVICMVWTVNLYNFMDGSDGLAGGMALFGFSTYAIAAYIADDAQLTLMSTSIASASFAFLFFNFNPAKIFMGDGGSVPLGFLAASLGIYGWQHGIWSLWFPILVFSPFIIDASVTLIKRLLSGEKFWEAHRSHYYQRLVQLGLGHKKTALFEYILMVAVSVTALGLLNKPCLVVWIALFIWSLIFIVLMWAVDRYWMQRTS